MEFYLNVNARRREIYSRNIRAKSCSKDRAPPRRIRAAPKVLTEVRQQLQLSLEYALQQGARDSREKTFFSFRSRYRQTCVRVGSVAIAVTCREYDRRAKLHRNDAPSARNTRHVSNSICEVKHPSSERRWEFNIHETDTPQQVNIKRRYVRKVI